MNWDTDEVTTNRATLGRGDPQQISEADTPSAVVFTSAKGRDIHERTVVLLRNPTETAASTDVTVERLATFGASVTQEMMATKSVSLEAGERRMVRFTHRDSLADGYYRVEVALTGTTIIHDQTVVETEPALFALSKKRDGGLGLTDREGRSRFDCPTDWSGVRFPGGVADQHGNRVSDFAGPGVSVSGGTLMADTLSVPVTMDGTGTSPVSIPHGFDVAPASAVVSATTTDAATSRFFVSGKTATHVEVSYLGSAPPLGTGNLGFDMALGFDR